MRFRLIVLLFVIIFMCSCGGYKIYNTNKYNRNSANFFVDPPLMPNFIICSEIFAKRSNINYEAGLKCATIQKKAQLEDVRLFTTCYLFRPVTSVYKCV